MARSVLDHFYHSSSAGNFLFEFVNGERSPGHLLGAKTSPWHRLFWTNCFGNQWVVSCSWICLCHVMMPWTDMLVIPFARTAHHFFGPDCTSSFAIDGWVCQPASLVNMDHDYSHIVWAFPPLDQLRNSHYNWKCIFFLFELKLYKQYWSYLTVLYEVSVCIIFPFLKLEGLCPCGQVLLKTDPCGSFDIRLDIYHQLFLL